jgi:hypothetical protein
VKKLIPLAEFVTLLNEGGFAPPPPRSMPVKAPLDVTVKVLPKMVLQVVSFALTVTLPPYLDATYLVKFALNMENIAP